MSILVITTGGTIGAMPYKDLKRQAKIKTMPAKGQDFVRTSLQKIPTITRCVPLEPRDSNHIDVTYRQIILDVIKQSPETMVLITHGTDTILQTADFLYQQASQQQIIRDKTIILTGSVVALSCGEQSDGMQNLRFSLRQLEQGQIARGIYIVLSDYQEVSTKTGWSSRLYRYMPNTYEKHENLEDNSRSRIRRLS